MKTIEYVEVARKKKLADLVLKNGFVVNVFSGEIEQLDVAIHDGIIIGLGKYRGIQEIDVSNKMIVPGFIDGHVHIESSMLTPPQFAKLVLPKGTTSIIADPHEIANVAGIKGIQYMLKSSDNIPLDVYMMIPSCVPATKYETSGATILADDFEKISQHPRVLGLGEMMDYPGVLNGDKEVHKKISKAPHNIIDGHAPGIKRDDINAYRVAGIKTDHECTTKEELIEKVKRGIFVHIREGSATRNLEELIKGVTKYNYHRLLFCTDDKHPRDIANEGHIDFNVRKAIKLGLDPINAIQMATINIANMYRLDKKGAIAPGFHADILVLDDLINCNVIRTFKDGKLVAKDGEMVVDFEVVKDNEMTKTVNIRNVDNINLDLYLKKNKVKVIQLVDQNIITKKVIRDVLVNSGKYMNNPNDDILKLAVVERHKSNGNIGLGLIEGYGLKEGAVAMTIAHDSHNMVVVGDNDDDMKLAIKELSNINGGVIICSKGEVLEKLPLEVGGIMTNNDAIYVQEILENMEKIATKHGIKNFGDPFLTLAFLSLPVIPELKLTDYGLFDVNEFKITKIEADL